MPAPLVALVSRACVCVWCSASGHLHVVVRQVFSIAKAADWTPSTKLLGVVRLAAASNGGCKIVEDFVAASGWSDGSAGNIFALCAVIALMQICLGYNVDPVLAVVRHSLRMNVCLHRCLASCFACVKPPPSQRTQHVQRWFSTQLEESFRRAPVAQLVLC